MLDRYPMPKMSAKAPGTSTVVRRKARPRICSRYSRLATRRILRIGFASHGLDENLFERGLDQFKAINRRGGGGLMQQLLCVCAFLEANLCVAGIIVGFGDFRAVQKRR